MSKKFACASLLLLFLFPLSLSGQESQESGTLKILQALIRIDTSNPPGDETRAAEFVRDLLAENGIPSEIIESAPGRGNLIARLHGSGAKPAMILLGHLDVVPADPAEWAVDPFSATIKDGRIWGRGALDMKGMIAMELTAFLKIKRENVPLAGDLLLVLCADEEAGGEWGAEFLVKNHWDKIEAKYLFNEGSVGVEKMGLHLYPIQVAEKGVAWMRMTAHGRSGHGSMPISENAVSRLARAVARLSEYRFPVQRTEVVEAFLRALSEHLSFPKSWALRNFFHPILGPVIQRVARSILSEDRSVSAILSHTVSPTMLEAGYKVNVIPSEAQATLDARILPGETPQGFRDQIGRIVGKGFYVELLTQSLPNQSDFRTDYFRAIEEAIRKRDPQAVTAPMLSAGATDSRFFREKGVVSYGIIPLLLTTEELQGLHGKNERVPVEGLEKGAAIVYDIVMRMLGPS